MLGQLPFSGSAIVDFGAEGEPDFTLDSSFAQPNEQEPDWYLAVASHFPVAVDGYTLVQLPLDESDSDADEGVEELEALRRTHAQLQAEVERLRKAERTSQKSPRDDERVSRLESALAERDRLLREAEQRLNEAQRRIEQAEEEATEAQTALDAARRRAESERKQREAEVARAKAEALKIAALKVAAPKSATPKVEAPKIAAPKVAAPPPDPAELQQSQADVAALEAKLEDRGRECQRLSEELRVSDKLAQELLSELEGYKEKGRGALPDPSLAELEDELRHVRATDARRVADLTTAQWTIQRLESQLGETRASEDR
jgi:chromosome segregation ATPase